MNLCEKPIFEMYLQCGLGKSALCQKCRAADSGLSAPISLWHVGPAYAQSRYRVLFVGKAARGSIEDAPLYGDTVADATAVAEELYYNSGWAFWSYIRTIANELYGEASAWDQIALTNMVKCNSSETTDTATQTAKSSCAQYLRQEIQLLLPRHIVFFTNSGYDSAIQTLFDWIEDSRSQDVPCGEKTMHLWRFTAVLGEARIRALRTGHPERMRKDAFVKQITDFIREEGNNA